MVEILAMMIILLSRENICVKDQGIDHEFDIRFVHWNKKS